MQHSTWESVQTSVSEFAVWVPAIAGTLLVAKGIAVATAAAAVVRHSYAAPAAIAKLVAIWSAIVLAASFALAILIPDPQATVLSCLAFVIIVIPLSRTIILPLCLAANRHR